MLNWLAALANVFGFRGLDFRISPADRNRLLWLSVLPLLSVGALVVSTAIYHSLDSYYPATPGGWDSWERLFYASGYLAPVAQYTALGVLFLGALASASRPLGSWSVLTALALLILGLACGLVPVVMTATERGPYDVQLLLYPHEWSEFSSMFGMFALGYAFLAFRGLTYAPPVRRRSFRYRPRRGNTPGNAV